MTAISQITSSLQHLSLGEPQKHSQAAEMTPACLLSQEEKDYEIGYAECVKLQKAHVVDANFTVLNEAMLGPIPSLNNAAQANIQDLIQQSLVFPFFAQSPDLAYTLEISYVYLLQKIKFIREAAFSPLQSIRIVGSGAAKILSAKWYEEALFSLRQNPNYKQALEQLHFTPSAVEAQHIDTDADDIDTHIDVTNARSRRASIHPLSVNLEMVLIDQLIHMHYQKVSLKVRYKDGSEIEHTSFYEFLHYNSVVTNRGRVTTSIEMASPQIPWLRGRTLSFLQLTEIWAALDTYQFSKAIGQKNQALIDSVLLQLACTYLFRLSYDEMVNFIIYKATPFIHFHALQKQEIQQSQVVFLRDWHRICCKDRKNETHDLLIMRLTKTPAIRTAFQNLHLNITSLVNSPRGNVQLQATWQAVLDKYFRLIRWSDLRYADPRDWGLFWFYVTKKHTCVLADTQDILQNCFLDYCASKNNPCQAFCDIILEKTQKRSKVDVTLNFAYIFNALSTLPEKLFSPPIVKAIWATLKSSIDIEGYELDAGWKLIAAPLLEEKIDYATLQILLKKLAYSYLLLPEDQRKQSPLKAAITLHNEQKAIQVSIGKLSFIFATSLLKDLTQYAECLANKSDQELLVISSITSGFALASTCDINAHSGLHTPDTKDTDALQISATALMQNKASAEGYQLLILLYTYHPTEANYLSLLRYFPDLVARETDERKRRKVCQFLLSKLDTLTGISVQTKKALQESLSLLSDWQNLSLHYVKTLLIAENDLVNQIGLELLQKTVSTLETAEAKKELFSLVETLSAKRTSSCLRVLQVLKQLHLGKPVDWLKIFQLLHESLSKAIDTPLYATHFYSLVSYVRLSQKEWPKDEKIFDNFFYKVALSYFERHLAPQAVNACYMIWQQDADFALTEAVVLYRSLETKTAPTNVTALNTLIPLLSVSEQPLLRELATQLFLALATTIQKLQPNCQIAIDESLQTVLRDSKSLPQAKAHMQEFLKRRLSSSPKTLWMAYCENVQPAEILEAYNMGTTFGLWIELSAKTDALFICMLIQKLYQADRGNSLVLADTLFSQGNGSISPFLDAKVLLQAEKRQRMRHLRERVAKCNLTNFSQQIQEILRTLDKANPQECDIVFDLCLQWLPQLIRKNKKRASAAFEILKNQELQALYCSRQASFLQLSTNCLQVDSACTTRYLHLLTTFINSNPPKVPDTDFTEALEALFDHLHKIKSTSALLLAQMSLLAALPSVSFPLWQKTLKIVSKQDDSIECKKFAVLHAQKIIKKHELVETIDECNDWFITEVITLRLLCELYCQTKLASDLSSVEAAYTELQQAHPLYARFASRHLREMRLSRFLGCLLSSYESQYMAPPKELRSIILSCRSLLKKYLDLPENRLLKTMTEVSFIKVMRYVDNEQEFLAVCQAQEQLFTTGLSIQETIEEHCDLFFTLMCSSQKFYGTQEVKIFQSLSTALAHYQKHLGHRKDPLLLIATLLGLPQEQFLLPAAQIALGRLRKEYRYDLPKIGSEEWKQHQVYYKTVIERLLDASNEEYLTCARALIHTPQACPYFESELRREYIATFIAHKLVTHPTFPLFAKKIVEFLNHIRFHQFTFQPQPVSVAELENNDFGNWVKERKKSMVVTDFSCENMLSIFMTGYSYYLVKNHTAKQLFSPACFDNYFTKVLAPSVRKQTQDISILTSELIPEILPLVIMRLLKSKTCDLSSKKVLLCNSFMLCCQAIQAEAHSKELLLKTVDHFFRHDELLNDDLAHFHTRLCKMLLDEADSKKLLDDKAETRFFLLTGTYGEIIDTCGLSREAQFPIIKHLIDYLLERKDYWSKRKALQVLQSTLKQNMFFSTSAILQWNTKLLKMFKDKQSFHSADFELVTSIITLNISIFKQIDVQSPENHGNVLAALFAQDEALFEMAKLPTEIQKIIIQFGLDLLKIYCQLSQESVSLATLRLNDWIQLLGTVFLSKDQAIIFYCRTSQLLMHLYTSKVPCPSYECIWANTLTAWHLFLHEKNDPYSNATINWLSQKVKTLKLQLPHIYQLFDDLPRVVSREAHETILAELAK